MRNNLNALLAKREALEKQILAVQELEKRKKRVHQIVFGVLEKHPGAARADNQVIREALNKSFSEIAQNQIPDHA